MKLKLLVLFGDKSVEHEVSVISALQAVASMDADKYEIIPVYITKENEFYTGLECSMIEEYKDIPALIKKSTRCVFLNTEGRVQLMCYPFKKFGSSLISDSCFSCVKASFKRCCFSQYFRARSTSFSV